MRHAALWEDGVVTALVSSLTPGGSCTADAINNRGQVVGSCDGTPFLWEDGVLTRLPTLPGGDFAGAEGINGFGIAVGASQTVADAFHAVFWWREAVFELAQLPGSTVSLATAINNWGQIVGQARDASGGFHAVLWQWGRIVSLETVPGVSFSRAEAINDRRQIVGQAGAQPVLWEHRSRIQLPGLRDGDIGGAFGINNRGDIVGVMGPPDTEGNAVLWTHRPPR